MGGKAGIRLEAIRELLRGLIAAGETDKAIDQAMLIITCLLYTSPSPRD